VATVSTVTSHHAVQGMFSVVSTVKSQQRTPVTSHHSVQGTVVQTISNSKLDSHSADLTT